MAKMTRYLREDILDEVRQACWVRWRALFAPLAVPPGVDLLHDAFVAGAGNMFSTVMFLLEDDVAVDRRLNG